MPKSLTSTLGNQICRYPSTPSLLCLLSTNLWTLSIQNAKSQMSSHAERSPRVCRLELPPTARPPPAHPSARPPSAFRAILFSHQIRFRRLLPPRCNSLLNVTAVFQMYFEIRETLPGPERVDLSGTIISYAPPRRPNSSLRLTSPSTSISILPVPPPRPF